MPRYNRIIRPGSVVHVIARFVNNEFLVRTATERAEYLNRLGAAIQKSDWRLLAYVVMSSHIHWKTLAGRIPFKSIAAPVHGGFARWLNRHRGRLGPVFADRPTTLTIDPIQAPRLISYIHNNPVRAGTVDGPLVSDWSSHRAYCGLEPVPEWLDVELGLKLAGFSNDDEGREAFHQCVLEQSLLPHDELISGTSLLRDRHHFRELLGAAIEVGYPRVDPHRREATYPIVSFEGVPLGPCWHRPLTDVLQFVADETGVPVHIIQSPSRRHEVVAARRLFVLMARDHLGRTQTEVAAHLRISQTSASRLATRADSNTCRLASRFAAQLLQEQEKAQKA